MDSTSYSGSDWSLLLIVLSSRLDRGKVPSSCCICLEGNPEVRLSTGMAEAREEVEVLRPVLVARVGGIKASFKSLTCTGDGRASPEESTRRYIFEPAALIIRKGPVHRGLNLLDGAATNLHTISPGR